MSEAIVHIAHWHRDGFVGEDIREWEEEWLAQRKVEKAIILPLYLYEHTGQTVSLKPFNDRFDSGQVGWIWVAKEHEKRALEYIHAAVKDLDQYLQGDLDVSIILSDYPGWVRRTLGWKDFEGTGTIYGKYRSTYYIIHLEDFFDRSGEKAVFIHGIGEYVAETTAEESFCYPIVTVSNFCEFERIDQSNPGLAETLLLCGTTDPAV